MRVVSLFSGIGGFETAFGNLGWETVLMCENDPLAASVLRARYPQVPIAHDVKELKSLPDCDILVAGWPCQDLSQAGRTAGITGSRSGLVGEVFRLIDAAPVKPKTILLENVAFALTLQKGAAIEFVVRALEERGYRWSYRILDTQFFGLPQRRRRVFICASLDADPKAILLPVEPIRTRDMAGPGTHVGFYWTEGNSGIGWTDDAVPPLKGGSSISIPSPPAIWNTCEGTFSTPSIEDAERLQGFSPGWTDCGLEEPLSHRGRWRLVGNAVSVPVALWLGHRIAKAVSGIARITDGSEAKGTPNAATGGPRSKTEYIWGAFEGPGESRFISLSEFGFSPTQPLSQRAALGFLGRYRKSKLKRNERLLKHLEAYCAVNSPSSVAAPGIDPVPLSMTP
jgi:DNA (cytosine-5)-methyltransferase 1